MESKNEPFDLLADRMMCLLHLSDRPIAAQIADKSLRSIDGSPCAYMTVQLEELDFPVYPYIWQSHIGVSVCEPEPRRLLDTARRLDPVITFRWDEGPPLYLEAWKPILSEMYEYGVSMGLRPDVPPGALSGASRRISSRAHENDLGMIGGRRFWTGSASTQDGKVDEVHSYRVAKENDFHHRFFFSGAACERIEDGESVVFWIDNDTGSVCFDRRAGMEEPAQHHLSYLIKQQIELMTPEQVRDARYAYLLEDIAALQGDSLQLPLGLLHANGIREIAAWVNGCHRWEHGATEVKAYEDLAVVGRNFGEEYDVLRELHGHWVPVERLDLYAIKRKQGDGALIGLLNGDLTMPVEELLHNRFVFSAEKLIWRSYDRDKLLESLGSEDMEYARRLMAELHSIHEDIYRPELSGLLSSVTVPVILRDWETGGLGLGLASLNTREGERELGMVYLTEVEPDYYPDEWGSVAPWLQTCDFWTRDDIDPFIAHTVPEKVHALLSGESPQMEMPMEPEL